MNGVLIIGGYELKELAGKVSFEEAAYLLWKGNLPNADDARTLTQEIAALRVVPEAAMNVVREAAAKKAPPIDALRMACATLSLDLASPSDISPAATGIRVPVSPSKRSLMPWPRRIMFSGPGLSSWVNAPQRWLPGKARMQPDRTEASDKATHAVTCRCGSR